MVGRTHTALTALALLTAAACSSGRAATPALPGPTPSPTVAAPHPLVVLPGPTASPAPKLVRARPVAAALVPYGSCRTLLRSLRKEALSEVTATGLPGSYYGGAAIGVPVAMPAMAAGAPMAGTAATTGSASSGSSFSGTNNQEAGVDEPDLVKTDGHLMVVAQAYPATLRVLDVSGSHPRRLAHLALALDGPRLFLVRDTVLALGQRWTEGKSVTVVQVISLADPAHPRQVRAYTLDGSLLDARYVHGRVVLVTTSNPAIAFTYPQSDKPAEITTALLANQLRVQRSTQSDWLPAVRVSSGQTLRAQCSKVLHPGVASGTATTSVVTLDPAVATPTQNVAVVGGSSVMYASTAALYLSTSSWRSQQLLWRGRGDNVTTDLHGFDLTDPDHLQFLGSGSVEGSLTDQYSLSEAKGYLRVATTLGDPVPPVGEGEQPALGRLSDNRVAILQPTEGVLRQVGQIRGLGRGQRIFGVRFLGDVGYVVTFRTIDPLYVLDLADPRKPRTMGALHITGFSSALYPLSDGQLLGVGQAVGDHQQQLGAQVEVFDVHQQAHPRLTGKAVISQGFSTAADDHHSLLWWAPKRLVVLPLQAADFGGSVVYRVSTAGALTEVGRVRGPKPASDGCCSGSVLRSLVVGDLLYSVTDSGLVTNPIDKVTQQAWLPFG